MDISILHIIMLVYYFHQDWQERKERNPYISSVMIYNMAILIWGSGGVVFTLWSSYQKCKYLYIVIWQEHRIPAYFSILGGIIIHVKCFIGMNVN